MSTSIKPFLSRATEGGGMRQCQQPPPPTADRWDPIMSYHITSHLSSKSNNVAHRHADLGVSQADVEEAVGDNVLGVEPKAAKGYGELLHILLDIQMEVRVRVHEVHPHFFGNWGAERRPSP